MTSADPGRPGHVRKRWLAAVGRGSRLPGMGVEPTQIPAGQLPQRLVRFARQRQYACRASPKGRLRRGWRRDSPRHPAGTFPSPPPRDGNRHRQAGARRRAPSGTVPSPSPVFVPLQNDMGIRARPPEPAHTRGREAAGSRPHRPLRRHLEGQPIPIHLRAGIPEVQMPRDRAVWHGEHDLHHAGHPRGSLQMPDVGLDRTDEQRVVVVVAGSIGVPGGVGLYGITDQRAGPVRLDVVHIGGPKPGAEESVGDNPLLRGPAGHRKSRTRPVLVHRGTADHGPYAIAVGLRLAQPLQHHDAAALAANVSVGCGVEGRAPPVRRQHPGGRAHFQQSAGEDRVHASRQGQIRLSPLQARHGLMDRHQRRRAGRIQRNRRPLQTQREGDPADGGIERCAGDRIEARRRLGGVAYIQDQTPVFVVADPRIHPGAAALEPSRIHPRVLERVPTGLQHHPLLRVEELRFDRRDTEKGSVEAVEFVQVRSETARDALDFGVREEFPDPPDPRPGDPLDYRGPAFFEQAPESLDIVSAGEPAGHSDNRDGFGGRPGHNGASRGSNGSGNGSMIVQARHNR